MSCPSQIEKERSGNQPETAQEVGYVYKISSHCISSIRGFDMVNAYHRSTGLARIATFHRVARTLTGINERGGAVPAPPHLFGRPIWDCGRTPCITADDHCLKPYGDGDEKMKEGVIVVSVYAVGLACAVCVSESVETTTR